MLLQQLTNISLIINHPLDDKKIISALQSSLSLNDLALFEKEIGDILIKDNKIRVGNSTHNTTIGPNTSGNNLNFLIIGDKPTRKKVESAKELKIKIIDQGEFLKMLDKTS